MVYFILFPVLGAAIGWFTNYLALKFLFWPRQPHNIVGLVFQGVIPRRRRQLARAIGEVVATELLSRGQIAAAVAQPELRQSLAATIGTQVVRHLAQHRTLGLIPSALLNPVLNLVGQAVTKEVASMLASSNNSLAGELLTELDVAGLVEERLLAMDWMHLEGLVFGVAGRELKYIEYMGGALGAVIGLFQAVVLWLLQS